MDMKIGIDFDNTIVCYDTVFHRLAAQTGLIPVETPVLKHAVRERMRQDDRADLWSMLQGQVYGSCILAAPPFPGVSEFFEFCRDEAIEPCIISHKTRFAKRGTRYDLHQAALSWLAHHHFFERRLVALHNVYFEPTQHAKIRRIATARCTHFIDDLIEFLTAPRFPANTARFLFDPAGAYKEAHIERFSSWTEVRAYFDATVSI